MPQIMTPEEAFETICPFMSNRLPSIAQKVECLGPKCACWGWVDPKEGQKADYKDREITATTAKTAMREDRIKPDGDGWIHTGTRAIKADIGGGISHYDVSWYRLPISGHRRGQCEAMSPYIEVTGS